MDFIFMLGQVAASLHLAYGAWLVLATALGERNGRAFTEPAAVLD